MKMLNIAAIALAVLAVTVSSPSYSDDDKRKSRGEPRLHGKTVAEWSALWWQWAEATGFSQFNDGLVDCGDGQRGPVWFLAGTFGGPTDRECVDPIPKGKTLFFPLLNAVFYNDLTTDPPEDFSVAEKREALFRLFNEGEGTRTCALFSHANSLERTELIMAGNAIARVQSPPFPYLGDDEAVSDGFWQALRPPKNIKEIIFGGALCSTESTGGTLFEADTTLVFTVRKYEHDYGEHEHDDEDD